VVGTAGRSGLQPDPSTDAASDGAPSVGQSGWSSGALIIKNWQRVLLQLALMAFGERHLVAAAGDDS